MENTAVKQNLIKAEEKAAFLFAEAETRNLIVAGKTEKELNNQIFELAFELFGIRKYWHKRIIRSGPNTLKPYYENPPDREITKDDILFFDFGPIFEEWEADFGRTYVIGKDDLKLKLQRDIEVAWNVCKEYFDSQKTITGAELYAFAEAQASANGWEYGGEIAGHLIGHFPHERLETEIKSNYIHPENHQDMRDLDLKGEKRHWILEIHFVDKKREIGGFFEQLMT